MTRTEFRRLADAYGGNVARWPERVRAEAEALAGEDWAVGILRDATALDEFLAPPPTAIDAAQARRAIAGVTARIAAGQQAANRFAWLRSLVGPLPGMAAAGLLGAALGLSGIAGPAAGGEDVIGLLAAALSYSDPSFFAMGG